jgi:kumamolisin
MSESRKSFPKSILPLPSQPGTVHNGMLINAMAQHHSEERMDVTFSLAVPDQVQTQLEQYIEQGKTAPEDLQRRLAADPEEVKRVSAWLQQEGFRIEETSSDSIRASATVDQIAKSLGVNMVRVTKDGLSYNAASNPPSLPADIGRNVRAVLGLQRYRKAHKHSRMAAVGHGAGRHSGEPSPNVANAPPYLIREILKAYDAADLNLTGDGQTIAILIDTFPSDSDLAEFWRRNNSAATLDRISKINVSGGALPPLEGEETLDAEWTSGIAPGAKIRIYASGSLAFVDLDRALDRIISDASTDSTLRQVSISLGLGETFMAQDEVDIQHRKFVRLAAAGVNVFVSSGDAGSNPDDTGHGSNGPLQAEYESSDPCVIGVGGTSLRLTNRGTVASETAWPGSGGGTSVLFDRPVWQTNVPAGTQRLVPDVSLAADPQDGAFLVFQGQPLPRGIGGTSWSAPVWAGFCALINEARSKAGLPSLAFLNPQIYPLAGTPAFRDVVEGSNGENRASPGFDLVTGLGVPNVGQLISSLTRPATA